MGITKARRYCPEEDRLVLAEKQTPNHLLHLALSVITAGVWLPVWLLVALAAEFSPFYCPHCASKTEWEGAAKKYRKSAAKEQLRSQYIEGEAGSVFSWIRSSRKRKQTDETT